MIKEAAEGTTEMVACLFWMVKQTVIFKPFQSEVALAMSSPTFLGDYNQNKKKTCTNINKYCSQFALTLKTLTKPNGPILGAKEEVAPTSPPTQRKYTTN